MKSILVAAASVVALAGVALADGPAMMTDDQMDQVVGGNIVAYGNGTIPDGDPAQVNFVENEDGEYTVSSGNAGFVAIPVPYGFGQGPCGGVAGGGLADSGDC